MAVVNRATAHARKLQGEHSTHDMASGNPDRDVVTQTETTNKGANISPKTDKGDGTPQDSVNRPGF